MVRDLTDTNPQSRHRICCEVMHDITQPFLTPIRPFRSNANTSYCEVQVVTNNHDICRINFEERLGGLPALQAQGRVVDLPREVAENRVGTEGEDVGRLSDGVEGKSERVVVLEALDLQFVLERRIPHDPVVGKQHREQVGQFGDRRHLGLQEDRAAVQSDQIL